MSVVHKLVMTFKDWCWALTPCGSEYSYPDGTPMPHGPKWFKGIGYDVMLDHSGSEAIYDFSLYSSRVTMDLALLLPVDPKPLGLGGEFCAVNMGFEEQSEEMFFVLKVTVVFKSEKVVQTACNYVCAWVKENWREGYEISLQQTIVELDDE